MATAVKFFDSKSGKVSYDWNDDKRSYLLIKLVREGITYSDFNKVTNLAPFSTQEWAGYLNISVRTLERNREENKVFRQEQSERILSIYQLLNYGKSVFGHDENFYEWLGSESIALGGIKPKELLDTSIGIHMVKDELGRLEHGVLT
ncbi:antitoxin Xre/MbcA/ParS toxin-binding domain-containing protein [Pseudozobellia sp. WGM2]|uniref:type II RES/Xre toxin-antitoxin system antitoxin n=1 Tax=Pseudozobellia sp. WGM2 TaxID=2787625 RepID=UPI001ADF060A|nr:antitoxin Xre/MbcA/ParS toxin-binding domain-containing protein [Pseudozobellia sp. WGM2]